MVINLDKIKSNDIAVCADCKEPIDGNNASGWEVFVTPTTTQPICKFCDIVRSFDAGEKENNDYRKNKDRV